MGDGGYLKETKFVNKTADEDLTNDAALNDDSELILEIEKEATYRIESRLLYDAGAGGIQVSVNGPAGAGTGVRGNIAFIHAGGAYSLNINAYDAPAAIAGVSAGICLVSFVIANGITAGNFIIRWAQQAANGAVTKIKTLSDLKIERF